MPTRTVFTALATATVLGTGLTAASAAPVPDHTNTIADSTPKPPRETQPTPDKKKPDTPEEMTPPEHNDAKPTPDEETTKPQPTWVAPSPEDISDTFGPRGWRGGQMHNGLDFLAAQGQPNHAAAAGTVTQTGYNGGYGLTVTINHGNGIQTIYAHHSQLSVNVGDTVTPGHTIGLAGSTGDSTGPHLHFEIHINNQPIDPYQYLTDKGINL